VDVEVEAGCGNCLYIALIFWTSTPNPAPIVQVPIATGKVLDTVALIASTHAGNNQK